MKGEIIKIVLVSLLACFMIVSGFVPSINEGFSNVSGGESDPVTFGPPFHDPIRINSDIEFNSTNGVQSGSGTAGDPYVIEDWGINGTGGGYCVYIGNTTKHFVINRMYIYGATGPNGMYYWRSSLVLYNVSNGLIKNSYFEFNYGSGIRIEESSDIKIVANNIKKNFEAGLRIEKSDTIEIERNNITQNNRYSSWSQGGILLDKTNNIITKENFVDHNPKYGVHVRNSHHNDYFLNDILYNCGGEAGLYLLNTNNQKVENNDISNSTGSGIEIDNTTISYFANNTIHDNDQLGSGYWGVVAGGNSHNNTWINNSIMRTKTGMGMALYTGSDHNYLEKNRIGNHSTQGLYLSYSHSVEFINNQFYGNNFSGLEIYKSKRIKIDDNLVLDNNQVKSWSHAGVKIERSWKNTCENNTVSDNPYKGVWLYYSNDQYIAYNQIIKNCGGEAGLFLQDSHNNRVLHNNISNSTGHGIEITSSTLNLFKYNKINDNDQDKNGYPGIHLYGSSHNNTFIKNTIYRTKSTRGIYVRSSSHYNSFIGNKIANNFYEGFYLNNVHHITIEDNEISWNEYSGIRLYQCRYVDIIDNEVWENNQNPGSQWQRGGIELEQSYKNTIEDNYVHNNPYYGVHLKSNSNNNLITDNDILFNCGGQAGLYLANSHDNEIIHNNVSNSTGNGIELYQATFNLIDDNILYGNNQKSAYAGIYGHSNSHNNTIVNNTIEHTLKGPGIDLRSGSDFTTISNNEIGYNEEQGIEISTSHNCTIIDNNFYWNYNSGIYLGQLKYSLIDDNEIWRNNQIDSSSRGGIKFLNSWENTINKNYIHDNRKNGIYINGALSDKNLITENDIIFNCGGLAGVNLQGGDNNQVLSNNISNGTGNGIEIFNSFYNLIDNNIIMGNNFSGIFSHNAFGHVVTNNTIMGNNKVVDSDSEGGIFFVAAPHSIIHNNTISNNNFDGIHLADSENSTISYNIIEGNGRIGINFTKSFDANPDYLNVHNNSIGSNNHDGIRVYAGYHNFTDNDIYENKENGILLYTDDNTITYNSFVNNTLHAIYLDGGQNNLIHHNNFVNNNGTSIQAYDNSGLNQWDNGTEGNYWSDYENRYVPPATSDGTVWSIPYNTSGDVGAQDRYPLGGVLNFDLTDNSLTTGTTGEDFVFKALVINSVLADTYVVYWYGTNKIGAVNVSMDYLGSDNWELTIGLPSTSIDPLNYYIHSIITTTEFRSIGPKTVTITDNDPPTAAAGTDIQIDVGTSANFNDAGSGDNIGVVNYTWSFEYDGFTTEVFGASASFLFNIPGIYTVTLTVKDAAGLSDQDELIVTVGDQEKPEFLNVSYPATVFIGDAFEILVNITDHAGINVIMLNYTDVDGNNHYVAMTLRVSHNYGYTVPGQPTIGFVSFFIWANDTFGNWQQSEGYLVEVLDNIKPVIHDVVYPSPVETDTGITVTVDATDNIDIDFVMIYYTDVNGVNHSANVTMDADGNYTFEIPGQDSEGNVDFHIFVMDENGNWVESTVYSVDIIKKTVEVTKPEIEFVTLPSEKYVNEDILIEVEVTDPAGVDKVYLNYTDTNNTIFNETMSLTRGVYKFTIPGQIATGSLKLFVLASNVKGFWNWTSLKTIIIAMVPPPIKDLYPPYVVSITPKDGSANVSVDTKIVIKFNESMNRTSVSDALNVVHDLNMSFLNDYTLGWSDDNKTLTITFDHNLTGNTTFFVTIDTKASDLEGNKLKSKFESKFRTIIDIDDGPFDFDKDDDGMDDEWEKENGLDPTDPDDASKDSDGDGLTNKEEFDLDLEPDDKDSDDDGMPDGWEVDYGLDPKTDNSREDSDGDGYNDLEEYEGDSDPTKESSVPTQKKEEKKSDNTMLLLLLIIIIVVVVALLVVMSRRKKKTDEPEAGEEEEAEEEESEDEEAEDEAADEEDLEDEEVDEEPEDLDDEAEEADEELNGEEVEEEPEAEEAEGAEDSEDAEVADEPIEEEADDEEDWDMPAEEEETASETEELADDDEEWDDWDSKDDDEVIEEDKEEGWDDWDSKVKK